MKLIRKTEQLIVVYECIASFSLLLRNVTQRNITHADERSPLYDPLLNVRSNVGEDFTERLVGWYRFALDTIIDIMYPK